MGSYSIALVLLLALLQDFSDAGGMAADSSDASSIPLIASGKRQHNIMRFGKRPAGGHSLIHFGKREDGSTSPPKHSFLYFGKRQVPDLLDYLQTNRGDGSYKRGHTIMRFGKRAPDSHNFIRFGRDALDDADATDDKRAGHAMMYFGKRAGHSMMYFGKRDEDDQDKRAGHSMMYFGKRDDEDQDKRAGHSMMYFGKRDDEDQDKRAGHSMMYFGKRDEDDQDKRAGHSMMYFGKRDDEDQDKRTGHSMMYFGKRGDEDQDKRAHAMIHFGKRDEEDQDKRAGHSMMYFGKRMPDEVPEVDYSPEVVDESKRGGGAHSMIHFGKREGDDQDWSPETKRQQHNLLRFGKKMDRKGSHAMIHFGKRAIGDEKRAHAMIHFGKRPDDEVQLANQSGPLNRMKREVDQPPPSPLITLVRYEGEEGAPPSPDEVPSSYLRPEEMWNPTYQDWESDYVEYSQQPDKKDASKNVFLRFG